jgi:uncharacterized protein YggE
MELERRAGSSSTISTMGYSLRPEYQYPREGREPHVSGYVATNTVRVTTPDLDRLGALVDAAIAAGANRIERLRFTLNDQQRCTLTRSAGRRSARERKPRRLRPLSA